MANRNVKSKISKSSSKTNRNSNCRRSSNRRNNNADYESDSREGTKRDLKSSTNDPAWYATDPSLLRDAASVPFSWAVGTTMDIGIDSQYIVPGICALETVPSYGYSSNPTSPLNVASRSIYSYIRHANSGHANYDAPDLMTYILEMSQIYSYINYLQRAYGVAMLYAQRNRYLPDALLRAMRIDAHDVQTHMAEFRYGINVLINKAASLAVPAVFTLFSRQAFMYQNIYSEGTSIKDQLYLYTPAGFWTWGTSDSASALSLVPFVPESVNPTNTSKLFTVSDLLLFGNNIISAVLASEDLNIMSGDILKAYGDAGIIKLVSLAPDYTITPIYDQMVLEQMKNSIAIGYAKFGSSTTWSWGTYAPSGNISITTFGAVEQDAQKGYLMCTPSLSNVRPALPNSLKPTAGLTNAQYTALATAVHQELTKLMPLMTTNVDEASPEVVMELSRLMCDIEKNSDNGGSVFSGSEILFDFKLIRHKYVPATETEPDKLEYYERSFNSVVITEDASIIPANDGEWTLSILSDADLVMLYSFKFRPTVYLYKMGGTTAAPTITFQGVAQNIDNYAVIDKQLLRKLNEAALLNQLHVDSIARVN